MSSSGNRTRVNILHAAEKRLFTTEDTEKKEKKTPPSSSVLSVTSVVEKNHINYATTPCTLLEKISCSENEIYFILEFPSHAK